MDTQRTATVARDTATERGRGEERRCGSVQRAYLESLRYWDKQTSTKALEGRKKRDNDLTWPLHLSVVSNEMKFNRVFYGTQSTVSKNVPLLFLKKAV